MTSGPQRTQLPIYDVSADAPHLGLACLHIMGLVAHPVVVTATDLAALPRAGLAEGFTCEEGWTVPDQCWRGIRLADVLACAQLLPTAGYVRVCAGEYAIPVALTDAPSALLCDEMNGQPLPPEHGAPWRLVLPGGACFTSVKWVDRLEVVAEPGNPDSENSARARLRRAHGA